MNNPKNKLILRFFESNIIRFVVVFFLVLLTVAIVTGIGGLSPRMNDVIDKVGADHPGYEYYNRLADNIGIISYVFPAMFIVVTLFVVFMSITRLVAVERRDIGTFRSLGFSKFATSQKYLLFVFLASFLGGVIGVILGYFAIHPILWSAISGQLDGGANDAFSASDPSLPLFGILTAVFNTVFAVIVVVIVLQTTLLSKPADILRPKTSKRGKKSFLEYIPFLWRLLGAKYRSTLRNVFRYKVRFIMSIFTMALSTILVFLGLGLPFVLQNTNPEILEVIGSIAALLAISAVVLCALVFYNITLINIEERIGEIATLMVLGCRKNEVVGYVFREIFILTVFGVALGLPSGYYFLGFLVEFLEFGILSDLNWWVWLIVGALSFVALGLAFLLLFRKIHKIDMNASLKFKTD